MEDPHPYPSPLEGEGQREGGLIIEELWRKAFSDEIYYLTR
jgi:hypothetical protein